MRGMSNAQELHHYLEASALAFADRAKYLGDPAYVRVPRADLLSDRFAASRACLRDHLGDGHGEADRGRQRRQLRRPGCDSSSHRVGGQARTPRTSRPRT